MNDPVNDPLRPSLEQSSTALHKSRRVWRSLLVSALSARGFPFSCANVSSLLHHTPSIPSRSAIEESVGDSSLYLEGFSIWGLGPPHCDLAGRTRKSRLQRIDIGWSRPNFCQISRELFSEWPGFEDSRHISEKGNYIFAFVLGWAYVLSSRLVELRKEWDQDKICYTEEKATCNPSERADSDTDGFPIPVGRVETAECRWWAAILASGCGWRATLCRSEREFCPSWSCHLDNDSQPFQIRYEQPMSSSSPSTNPPSSMQALRYLYNFAQLHNAYDQLLAAFSAALTIPQQGRFGATITLPCPEPMCTTRGGTHSSLFSLLPSKDDLPHLMAFSCVPNTIASSMLSCLWEPNVTCNLVSEWLCPPLEEIVPSLMREKRFDAIVRIMAVRRPNSASLWLGSAITGLLPRLFEIAGTYLPSICLEATQWTGSSQSFMDPRYYQKARVFYDNGRKLIRREDEFRLLYLTDIESDQHGPPPLCPWKPFGMTDIKSTAIEVQNHAFCGHDLNYDHWVWQGSAGEYVNDLGVASKSKFVQARHAHGQIVLFLLRLRSAIRMCWQGCHEMRLIPQVAVCCSETLSRSATRNLFTWTLPHGTKPEESALWRHEWLEDLLDDEDEQDDTVAETEAASG